MNILGEIEEMAFNKLSKLDLNAEDIKYFSDLHLIDLQSLLNELHLSHIILNSQ